MHNFDPLKAAFCFIGYTMAKKWQKSMALQWCWRQFMLITSLRCWWHKRSNESSQTCHQYTCRSYKKPGTNTKLKAVIIPCPSNGSVLLCVKVVNRMRTILSRKHLSIIVVLTFLSTVLSLYYLDSSLYLHVCTCI